MKSNKTKEQIYKETFDVFTKKEVPLKMLRAYMNDEDGQATSDLQCWIVNNMKTQ